MHWRKEKPGLWEQAALPPEPQFVHKFVTILIPLHERVVVCAKPTSTPGPRRDQLLSFPYTVRCERIREGMPISTRLFFFLFRKIATRQHRFIFFAKRSRKFRPFFGVACRKSLSVYLHNFNCPVQKCCQLSGNLSGEAGHCCHTTKLKKEKD